MDDRDLTPPHPAPPKPPWSPLDAVVVALAAIVALLLARALVAPLLGDDLAFFLAALVFESSLAIGTLLWVAARHRALPALRLASSRPLADALVGAGSGVAIFFTTTIVVAGFLLLVLRLIQGEPVELPQQQVLPQAPNPLHIALGAHMAIVAAPIGEELFFRGFLQGALRARMSFWPAASITSAFFAVFHVIPVLMPLFFVAGLGFGWVFERRGSLVAAIAAHAAFNVVGYALLVRAPT